MSGDDVRACLDAGDDVLLLGRATIVHHDFPNRPEADANFESLQVPVSIEHPQEQGLSKAFIDYLSSWPGFIKTAR